MSTDDPTRTYGDEETWPHRHPGDGAREPGGATVIPLPVHVLPGALNVRRSPGRPRKVRPAPSADEAEYLAAIDAAQDAYVESDAVVEAAKLKDTTGDLLDRIIVAVAAEAASLAWECRRLQDQRALERARSRRVRALEVLARLVLERQRVRSATGEIPAGKLKQVVDLFVSSIEEVVRAVLTAEDADRVMAEYRTRIQLKAEGFTAQH